jgi:hypothetical protein
VRFSLCGIFKPKPGNPNGLLSTFDANDVDFALAAFEAVAIRAKQVLEKSNTIAMH